MADRDLVLSKLGRLETYLEGLEAKRGVSFEEYENDRDLRDIVERRFEKAIQASLDVAAHVVSADGYREPQNYGDLFAILAEEDVLRRDTAEDMIEMAGFRNVLAHEYAGIDDRRVYDHLENLDRFRQFAEELLSTVERTDSG